MKNGLKRVLATALTLLIVMQCAPLHAFAVPFGKESPLKATTFASTGTTIELQNGSAVIPSGSDLETVKGILADTLIVNKNGVDTSSVEWEYYCTGKTLAGTRSKTAWVSISGDTIKESIFNYTFPALADNNDGDYQVRIEGTTMR